MPWYRHPGPWWPCVCRNSLRNSIVSEYTHVYRWTVAVGTHCMMTSWQENPFSMLTLCDGNPPVTCGFSSQRDSDAGLGILSIVSLNKPLNKQSNFLWFETLIWRLCNDVKCAAMRPSDFLITLLNFAISVVNHAILIRTKYMPGFGILYHVYGALEFSSLYPCRFDTLPSLQHARAPFTNIV